MGGWICVSWMRAQSSCYILKCFRGGCYGWDWKLHVSNSLIPGWSLFCSLAALNILCVWCGDGKKKIVKLDPCPRALGSILPKTYTRLYQKSDFFYQTKHILKQRQQKMGLSLWRLDSFLGQLYAICSPCIHVLFPLPRTTDGDSLLREWWQNKRFEFTIFFCFLYYVSFGLTI
jgi:hypothetical protein